MLNERRDRSAATGKCAQESKKPEDYSCGAGDRQGRFVGGGADVHRRRHDADQQINVSEAEVVFVAVTDGGKPVPIIDE